MELWNWHDCIQFKEIGNHRSSYLDGNLLFNPLLSYYYSTKDKMEDAFQGLDHVAAAALHVEKDLHPDVAAAALLQHVVITALLR